ncbi:bifunctional protein-disulfide isomerase/oxidoreductase DsbC [Thalassotalea ponticola]|uniref:bifunctional protein-disulfide isomerase/oxidoreductase DsbC n=1 Tax=Thalassotalea ponticola TaxID=1523392 RepID=UPI0025B507D4|nr:bifunctional protein-disulfide isomerase/oxidoreductase DsbC [Thalassotalea ponticola]MDN3651872.1 bifunctional protein-disulfide isomerase/oxidoreductase DsbC [Thalassotalea ponticola]
MKSIKKVVLFVSALMLSLTAHADNEQISKQFDKVGLSVESVTPSKVDGLYEVFTPQGLFYASKDGQFLIQGKVYQLQEQGIVSLTENSLAAKRIDGMKQFNDSMIVFPAADEKYQVTIFTDLTCGYCRRLHNQMQQYNEAGITVRYLAFPRGGLNSPSYNDIRSVWCSEDQQSAMTRAKGGAQIAQKVCDQPVAEQYQFGRKIGVSGTPAIMLENGTMVPGYRSPEELKALLDKQRS